MPAAKKQLLIEILSEVSGVRKGTEEAGRHLSTLSDRASRAGSIIHSAIGIVSVAAVTALGKELYQTAIQSQAFQARFNAVFGAAGDDLKEWANSHAAAFGVANDDVQGYLASIANMLVPMGYTAAAAGEQAKKILEAAGAWSVYSGGQIGVMDAAEKLTKGMLGQTRGLQELGINAAAVRDIEGDLSGETDELTGMTGSAADAQARWNRIVEQSGPAMQMYGEAMDGPAGKALALQSSVAQLKDELADELLPVLTGAAEGALDVAAGVQALLGWFENLSPAAKTAALTITGLAAALTALYFHPVLAGLALVAGAVAMIGGNARDTEQAAEDAKAAVEGLAEAMAAGPDTTVWLEEQFESHPEFTAWLREYGIRLQNLDAILKSGDWGVWYSENEAGIPLIERYNTPPGFPEFLQTLYSYYEQAGLQIDQDKAAVREEASHAVMLQRLQTAYGGTTAAQITAKRTTEEWTAALKAARQAVIDAANAQLAAASPVLTLLRVQRDHAAAQAAYQAAMADATSTEEERTAAANTLIEAQGNLNAAEAGVAATVNTSISNYRELAGEAGVYADQIQRIVGALWDYDAAPKPEPETFDLGGDEAY